MPNFFAGMLERLRSLPLVGRVATPGSRYPSDEDRRIVATLHCLYRPVSELPYPPAAIRRCCEFLIEIADTETGSSEQDHELLAKEREALGLALFSLDYFLDLPANEIPRRKLENLAYGP